MAHCPVCQLSFDADKVPGGICPRCMLTGGVGDEATGASSKAGDWTPPTVAELQALLGTYEIAGLIGRGGMGAVYKARQPSLDRTVAIKVLPAQKDDLGVGFSERFRNEARLMARMNHPGIVHVYDFGELAGGLCYFVMEFVEGTDVAQMVKGSGKLPVEHAVSITADVCAALHYAHEAGIVHRDIKPANILVTPQGHVKVADFGLAKSRDPADGGQTGTGLTLGTPDYAAPESLISGMLVDHRADIYAVGVMLYNMLTGEIPRGVFKPASAQTGASPAFDQIISKAMRADRDQRYQTAVDMKTDVQRAATRPPKMSTLLRFATMAAAAVALLAAGMWLRPFVVPEVIGAGTKMSAPEAAALADQERTAAEWVFSKGGKVVLEGMHKTQKIESPADLPQAPYTIEEIAFIGIQDPKVTLSDEELREWLPRLKGLKRLIVENSPGVLKNVTDEGLAAITKTWQMHTLTLDHLPITDERLGFLTPLRELSRLSLAGTQVTGSGLDEAPRGIVFLNLSGCPINDTGWDAVTRLGRLKFLTVSGDLPFVKKDFNPKVDSGNVDMNVLRAHVNHQDIK